MTGFYIDEQDGQDEREVLVLGFSPQPSPIKGEGEGTGFYTDGQDWGGTGIATPRIEYGLAMTKFTHSPRDVLDAM